MKELNEKQREEILSLIKKNERLPSKYKNCLFPSEQKEYELIYDGKDREEDILSDTMAVPLQPVKTFGKSSNGWTNKLIFGDNLQVMKELMNDSDVKGKVRLIYIDPPFGTGDIYDANGDTPAYSAKLQGVKYIEFVRKRLVFLKELLANDGSIYVRMDYHFGHYIKLILDEIFGKQNFRNEIVVKRGYVPKGLTRQFLTGTDSVFFYAKGPDNFFKGFKKKISEEEREWISLDMPGERKTYEKQVRYFFGKPILPPRGQHWGLSQERITELEKKGEIRIREGRTYTDLNGKIVKGMPEYLKEPELLLNSNWTDIPSYKTHNTGYPTENSEDLLERIIGASSEQGDIVLDAFAGSGTTGAVAEKLGRRWIMIDCGKLSIYTMQKRLLNLKQEIGNAGKPLATKSFTLYNAGLYDYKVVKDLAWEQYRDFALKLFQCRDEKHEISGVEIDGYYGSYHATVFNFKKFKTDKEIVLDKGYIDNLHKIIGTKIDKRFFIIVPAANVNFFETIVEKDDTKYYILTIPYSIINELHEKNFTAISQPVSEAEVNNTIDAVGFDFVVSPEVECKYSLRKSGAKDLFKNAVIKIKKFQSNPISKTPGQDYGFDTLSMVMIDFDYNGEVFDLDQVFYSDEIKNNDYEIEIDINKIKKQCMIIYIDIFGNEKREVKKVDDFK